ncbi:MAG: hypothetical protein AUI57_01550 [Candidatus Rokubacteria bacterium 13_1_40CM_2_68_8]|nr:MAG: hypothetical protein AUI57_01550 [Candidatus Rokubacteria bacterium 13_1_40CM_2_68_8]
MADLWTRISASRDYVAVFTVLGAALSLLLTQLGAATWQTISRILPAAAVVFAFLAWLRPRVFPTWRLLELCLYAGQRFPVTRSIDDALYCFWWAAWRRRGCRLRTFDVARLRVEAELLTGGKDRGGAASAERRWREHLEAMLNERRLMQYTSPADPRFRTEIPDCLPLTSSVVFPGVDHYFKTLASVGRADDHFLSEVHVTSAYVAPLYLLTGQLGHFDDNWRAIVHAYADVTSIHDPISDEPLRHLRAFQFACWIVWGPSIPICTCSSWNHEGKDAIGFQLGYGDENTSVILYDEGRALRLRLQRARRRVARALAPAASPEVSPLAVELDAVVVVRRPGFGNRARLCRAQAELLDADTDRLVLEFRRLDVAAGAGRSYYSAYLWVMFVLEAGPGNLLMSPGEPWRALLPFFVHGNIADSSTYAFLKERLANEALDAIEAVIRRPDTPPGVSFVYMSAIDDSGCGFRPLMPDPGEQIKHTLRRLLADRFRAIATRVRIEDDPASLRATDGTYYATLFSSCHLPETISTYFECLDHLGKGLPHGASVV